MNCSRNSRRRETEIGDRRYRPDNTRAGNVVQLVPEPPGHGDVAGDVHMKVTVLPRY